MNNFPEYLSLFYRHTSPGSIYSRWAYKPGLGKSTSYMQTLPYSFAHCCGARQLEGWYGNWITCDAFDTDRCKSDWLCLMLNNMNGSLNLRIWSIYTSKQENDYRNGHLRFVLDELGGKSVFDSANFNSPGNQLYTIQWIPRDAEDVIKKYAVWNNDSMRWEPTWWHSMTFKQQEEYETSFIAKTLRNATDLAKREMVEEEEKQNKNKIANGALLLTRSSYDAGGIRDTVKQYYGVEVVPKGHAVVSEVVLAEKNLTILRLTEELETLKAQKPKRKSTKVNTVEKYQANMWKEAI